MMSSMNWASRKVELDYIYEIMDEGLALIASSSLSGNG